MNTGWINRNYVQVLLTARKTSACFLACSPVASRLRTRFIPSRRTRMAPRIPSVEFLGFTLGFDAMNYPERAFALNFSARDAQSRFTDSFDRLSYIRQLEGQRRPLLCRWLLQLFGAARSLLCRLLPKRCCRCPQ